MASGKQEPALGLTPYALLVIPAEAGSSLCFYHDVPPLGPGLRRGDGIET